MHTNKPTDNLFLQKHEAIMIAFMANLIQPYVYEEQLYFCSYYGLLPIMLRFSSMLIVEVPITCVSLYIGRYAPGGVLGLHQMYPIMKGFFLVMAFWNPFVIYSHYYSPLVTRWFAHILTLPPDQNSIFYECLSSTRWACAPIATLNQTQQCCGYSVSPINFSNCTGQTYPLMEYYEKYFDDISRTERPFVTFFSVHSLFSFAVILMIGFTQPNALSYACGLFLLFIWIHVINDLGRCFVGWHELSSVFSFLLYRRSSIWDGIKVVLPLTKYSWLMTSACIPVYTYIGRRLHPSVIPYKVAFAIGLHRTVYSILGIVTRGCVASSLAVVYKTHMACLLEFSGHEDILTRVPQWLALVYGTHERLVRTLMHGFAVCTWYEANKAVHIYVLVDEILVGSKLLSSLHLKWVFLIGVTLAFHCLHALIYSQVGWRVRSLYRQTIDLCLSIQFLLFLLGLFWGLGTEKILANLHFIRRIEFPQGLLTLFEWIPFMACVTFFFILLDFTKVLKKADIYNQYDKYKNTCNLILVIFVVALVLTWVIMAIVYFFKSKRLRDALRPTEFWGPRGCRVRKNRLRFDPGRWNSVYDHFYMPDHRCLVGHKGILKTTRQMENLLGDVPDQMLRVRAETARMDFKRRLTLIIKEANSNLW